MSCIAARGLIGGERALVSIVGGVTIVVATSATAAVATLACRGDVGREEKNVVAAAAGVSAARGLCARLCERLVDDM